MLPASLVHEPFLHFQSQQLYISLICLPRVMPTFWPQLGKVPHSWGSIPSIHRPTCIIMQTTFSVSRSLTQSHLQSPHLLQCNIFIDPRGSLVGGIILPTTVHTLGPLNSGLSHMQNIFTPRSLKRSAIRVLTMAQNPIWVSLAPKSQFHLLNNLNYVWVRL